MPSALRRGSCLRFCKKVKFGGEGGIRTLEAREDLTP